MISLERHSRAVGPAASCLSPSSDTLLNPFTRFEPSVRFQTQMHGAPISQRMKNKIKDKKKATEESALGPDPKLKWSAVPFLSDLRLVK